MFGGGLLGVPVGGLPLGAAVSTVKLSEAGVGSTFPAGSVVRTSKVCGPSESAVVV